MSGRTRRPGRLAALHQRVRTEGGTPLRQASAIALGLYIGASPFMGLHLAISLALGWLLGLNRLKVYLAANISNPLFAPILYGTEIQIGAWIRLGHIYTPGALHELRLRGLALDVLIGSVIVGAILAVIGFAGTYALLRRGEADPVAAAVVESAAERYIADGITSWEIARGKLQMDPVYQQVLRDGVLPDAGTIVDIGCGQGYMFALVAAARDAAAAGRFPWPAPPRHATLIGIERRPRIARRAAAALEGVAEIRTNDAAAEPLPSCRGALLVDVLHLIGAPEQDRLIAAIRAALEPGGVLVIREADRAGGWRFQLVRAGNWFRALLEGHPGRRFHFGTAADWDARLRAAGFAVTRAAVGSSKPLANFLLYARRA